VLCNKTAIHDFHPWSIDEDEIIMHYAKGILEAQASPHHRAQYVLRAHNVSDPAEIACVNNLLVTRDYNEIASRARYLCDERQF